MHLSVLSLALLSTGALCRATTEIPTDSFNDLNTYWNYLYPWGDTHNGGARMDSNHVSVTNGILTLTTEPVTGEDGPINYLSGTIHAKQTFTISAGGGYDISAEFIAPVEQGTWPAFWLNAATGWPPEIDIAEWKGTGKILFNTFNTSDEVSALDMDYPSPEDWHSVRVEIRDENGTNVFIGFWLDGELGLRLSPGPTKTTTFQVWNIKVISQNP
ncbi:glycoside hydrolase family 16 protein [Aspergillus stella-maris]|uniref:glycoside hydrolase family 16 protein n=1 Tax=Aspergillus stella-maris TaxID=1810926 RepID=UPI003CCC925E